MNCRQVFSTVSCLACGLPRMGGVGQWVLSAVHQTSSIFRGASLTSYTRLFSSLPSSAASVRGSLVPGASVPTLASGSPMATQTRGRVDIYYRPSAWKRVNKHGIEKRLRGEGGVEVLWRRILRKRYSLTPFDRILPGTYNGQILPDHHLKYNKHLVDREVRKRVKQAIRKK